MKLKCIASTLLAVGLTTAFARAQPLMVNYQGRLSQLTGALFPNGPADVRIRLFDAATGGTQVWDSGIQTVQVRDGVFSLLLQGGTPSLTSAQFISGLRYFEISVRQGANWTTLSPRQVVTSAPWALVAGTVPAGAIASTHLASDHASLAKVTNGLMGVYGASNNAIGIGGAPNWKFEVLEAGPVAMGVHNTSSSVRTFISSTNAYGQLAVTPGKDLYLGQDGSAPVIISQLGRVGIQIPNPAYTLHVNGTAAASGTITSSGYFESSGDNHGVFFNRSANGGNTWILGQLTDYGGSPFDLKVHRRYGGGDQGIALTLQASTGNLGIGTVSPSAKLHVNGLARVDGDIESAGLVSGISFFGRLEQNGEVRIQPFNSGQVIVGGFSQPGLFVYGPASGTTAWQGPSDRRLKTRIGDITNPLATLLSLRGHTFEYRHDLLAGLPEGERMGFIAQEVELTLPNWVTDLKPKYKGLATSEFDALATEAIREQQSQIDALRTENRKLRAEVSRMNALDQRIARLEQLLMDRKKR
ncbi:MAG TPA: tail fiber domain-containing protein [Fimbriimonadaceae bacterium]|nr:tail fiber domain-containing protein [Fimbriimonadaceae bacterium]HRJ95236.1 tail fiber domain-containing protein [Fimbriimonadaceae bacterium]